MLFFVRVEPARKGKGQQIGNFTLYVLGSLDHCFAGNRHVFEAYRAQLNECSRQCSRPVLAQCSRGFGPNPLINGLILHTFKLNILFLEKFTEIHFD